VQSRKIGNLQVKLIDVLTLVEDCQIEIINDLHRFDLLEELSFKNHDTKRVFYYYILKTVCDVIIKSKGIDRCVFFYNHQCIQSYTIQFLEYSSVYRFREFLTTIINKMNNILPTLFYICDEERCFDDIISDIHTGEYIDISNDIIAAQQRKSNKLFTFEKAKSFVRRYGLTYLDRDYFNKVKIKTLLYR
jgi:hypothetical protein